MSDLLLTAQERERFASWLEREAATAYGLIDQMKKLNIGVAATILEQRERAEADAALLIARKLRATHSFEI